MSCGNPEWIDQPCRFVLRTVLGRGRQLQEVAQITHFYENWLDPGATPLLIFPAIISPRNCLNDKK